MEREGEKNAIEQQREKLCVYVAQENQWGRTRGGREKGKKQE